MKRLLMALRMWRAARRLAGMQHYTLRRAWHSAGVWHP